MICIIPGCIKIATHICKGHFPYCKEHLEQVSKMDKEVTHKINNATGKHTVVFRYFENGKFIRQEEVTYE